MWSGSFASASDTCFFFSSRGRHTRWTGDWSSDVCSSDLPGPLRERPGGRLADLLGPPGPGHDRAGGDGVHADRRAFEIGRASCRERVYVWVDAVELDR